MQDSGGGTSFYVANGGAGLNVALGSVTFGANSNQVGFWRSDAAANTTLPFINAVPNPGNSIPAGLEATTFLFGQSAARTHQSNTAIALNRDFRIVGTNHSFATAGGVLTDNAVLSVDGPASGVSNATITNSHGIYIPSSVVTNVTNSYGLNVNATTGATNNYAAIFNGGNVGIGTTSPTVSLDVSARKDAIRLPAGNDSTERPGTPANGMIRYNLTANKLEAYENGIWVNMIGGAALTSVSSISNTGGITLTPSAGNTVLVNQTTTSTSPASGALVVNGGAGIVENLNVGGNVVSNGSISAAQSTAATSGLNQNSPSMFLSANYWNGTSTALDKFSITNIVGTGANPSATLTLDHVAGGTTGTKSYSFMNGNVGIGTTSPAGGLDVTTNTTDPAIYAHTNPWNIFAGSFVTSKSYTIVNNGAASTAVIVGNENKLYADNGGAKGWLSASYNEVGSSGTATISGMYGSINKATPSNPSVGEAVGATGEVKYTTNGTVTSAYGLYAKVENTGGGTITNGYGVYAAPVAGTNSYGVYQESASNKNYFAGNVGIGTTAPTRLLQVAGAMNLSPVTVPASPTSGDMFIDSAGANALKYYNGAAWVSVASSASVTTNANALSAVTADFTSSVLIRSTAAATGCGTLNVTNTTAGGSYTLTLKNATTTCTTINWNGSATNVKLPAGYSGGSTVNGLVYTFLDDGAVLWVTDVEY